MTTVVDLTDRYAAPADQAMRNAIEANPERMARLLAEATEEMTGFGLDFTQLDGPTVDWDTSADGYWCDVVWTHSITGKVVRLTNVWVSNETGEIMQHGQNMGELIF